MLGLDDSGRIPPPKPSSSANPPQQQTSISDPIITLRRTIFPGFLSTENDDIDIKSSLSPASPPLSESPTNLPYLRESPASSSKPLRKVEYPEIRHEDQERGPQHTNEVDKGETIFQRRRPSPLQLGKSKAIGLDEELQVQRDLDGPLTGMSYLSEGGQSTLSNDMQDLSLLRQSVKQNLLARPVDSPLGGSESGGSSGALTPDFYRHSESIPDSETIPIHSVLELLAASSQTLILDTRPLGDFLEAHLPQSANFSIPSLIFKRFRKQSGGKSTTWEALASFVSTPAGRGVWDGLRKNEKIDIVVVGLTADDETARVLRSTMEGLITGGSVKVLRGGWVTVMNKGEVTSQLVQGEHSQTRTSSTPRTAPTFDFQPPPIPPNSTSPRISHHPSMPSLRAEAGPSSQRNLPSLSLHTSNHNSSKRPTKLSLNLDKPLRSATTGSFPLNPSPGGLLPVPGSEHRRAGPSTGLSISAPKSPFRASSFQTLCHEQSKLPPSPSSFGGVSKHMGQSEDLISPSVDAAPNTPWTSTFTAKPGTCPTPATPGDIPTTTMTARNGIAPFIVSTILPSFLYLGPEITSQEEVRALQKLGVKRILNVALECDDNELKLRDTFEKYMKVPMRDIVEESGVAKGMRDSCNFLDDARLHSAPTYVHCKAGKSRSVTVVLAYLIHANAWTLKTSYAYVAERRKGISPNIGFVAELMQFEETELGLKQSGGVHGEGSSGGSRKSGNDNGGSEDKEDQGGRSKRDHRYMRESLPPAWASSLDSGHIPKVQLHGNDNEEKGKKDEEEGRRVVGDEREVRKNGQWVHHRRAPVDRTTLQPGRRVSKAGLESLRPLATATSPNPSPRPSPGLTDSPGEYKPTTPGGEGRLGWV